MRVLMLSLVIVLAQDPPQREPPSTDPSTSEPRKLRPITGVEEVPPPPRMPTQSRPYWTAVCLVVVLALVCYWMRRRPSDVPPVPPDEWARQELDRLDRGDLLARGHAERFHTILSDVVRRYLDMRFDLRASMHTTEEILHALDASPRLTSDQMQNLRHFLEQCDLAKFAPVVPRSEDSRELILLARSLIDQTARSMPEGHERNGTATSPDPTDPSNQR